MSNSEVFPTWAITLMRTITGAAIIGGIGWAMAIDRKLATIDTIPARVSSLEASVTQHGSELAVLNTRIEYMVEGIDEIRSILRKD